MGRAVSWRGRAGLVFERGEPGRMDGTTADALAADRHAPQQDGQAGKAKLLARSCLRILVQSLRAHASPPGRETGRWHHVPHQGGTRARVDWTSRPLLPDGTHFSANTRSGRGRTAWGHALVESESLSLMR